MLSISNFRKLIGRRTLHCSIWLLFILMGTLGEIYAQQIDIVDFLKADATITPNANEKNVKGTLKYTFRILEKTDSIYLDAVNMKVVSYALEGVEVKAKSDKIWIISDFEKDKDYTVFFTYEAKPSQTLYFFGNEIWTQGQGKYTSHWLPSINDTNDKIEFDLTIVSAPEKQIIANGKLIKIEERGNENYWQFDMEQPMSSYLVAFAIGAFDKMELISNSGIPMEMYFKPDDSLKVEPTYRYSKRIFDFLETEIEFPFPWQNYKQVPLRDFLYAGMENTTATFFSEAFMVDSIGYNDRNYINVNAHELAHQWFGNMVTAKTDADHWLQEGFSTYYALLSEREIFGDDYYYWQLYQTAEQLKALSDEGKGESLLNPKASSLTFYQKGAWALHILREKIGEENFKMAVKNYLEKYKFQNVSTENFLNEVKAVSLVDISEFEENWLEQSAFQSEEAFKSLMKSAFIQNYFEISALRMVPLKDKKAQLRAVFKDPNDFVGQEAVHQLMNEPASEVLSLIKNAFQSNNLYVRQAIALSMKEIPKELQKEYESLLKDDSYVTLEAALYQIWTQFPEKRAVYLNETEGIIGFQNKNIRQLWLTLALITENYRNSEKELYLKELRHYSSPDYSFEIREQAFGYINELKLWDANTLKNLIEACVHPTWRFAKSSKEILSGVMQDEDLQIMFKEIENNLSEKAQKYLKSIIK